MPWTRLDPRALVDELHVVHEPGAEMDAGQALAHIRAELLSGRYIAVQDHRGHLFIGTPDEAADHMLEHG